MFNMMPYRANQNMALRENRGYFEDFANDFFRPFFEEGFGLMPARRPMKVDVRDEGDRFVLETDLPGMKKEDLKVEVTDGVLTIRADYEHTDEQKDAEAKYVYRERRTGSVSRSFDVDGIQEDGITAEFKDGVLRLNLPKRAPEEAQTHNIEING